jgi:hypothetical protein
MQEGTDYEKFLMEKQHDLSNQISDDVMSNMEKELLKKHESAAWNVVLEKLMQQKIVQEYGKHYKEDMSSGNNLPSDN